MSLAKNEIKTIEKVAIRNNFAIALTKRKEPLYWGTIEDVQGTHDKQSFTEQIKKIE